jgi:DNA replicative helicase MCM subunit Mcm2 (Cdc46/Mcm family)
VPLTSQLNISGPLLSRFDIVILLLDRTDSAWDEEVAQHLLCSHQCRGGAATMHDSEQVTQQYEGELHKVSIDS